MSARRNFHYLSLDISVKVYIDSIHQKIKLPNLFLPSENGLFYITLKGKKALVVLHATSVYSLQTLLDVFKIV